MEASYFYYRPSDLIWGGKRGYDLDKGFNVKFIYNSKSSLIPNVAIGLDDFAGTGYFTREYVVATNNWRYFTWTAGMGWGKYVGQNSYKNPLTYITNEFSVRPFESSNLKKGGSPSYDQWFRGDVSLFGGFEYVIPKTNGIKLNIEYDPFDYNDFSALNRVDAIKELREKKSNLNFGVTIPYKDYFTLDASYIKGNTFNLSFKIGLTFNKELSRKPKFNPEIKLKQDTQENTKKVFYRELLANLNKNNLYLQTAQLNNDGTLDISISTSEHRNHIRSSSYAAFISKKVADLKEVDLSKVNVKHINAGIELNEISYVAGYLDDKNNTPYEVRIRNTTLDSGNKLSYKDNEFQPKLEFPIYFSSISPTLITHIGNPSKFYYGGVDLQYLSELQFNRNLLLSIELNKTIYDNFREKMPPPDSQMENVRTNIVQYLKEDDMHISAMQLDYIWSPTKNLYAKISGGILESMYGGFGGEFLYKPFQRNFSIGGEIFSVQRRDFKQRFKFQDYKTITGHINFGYLFFNGIESNLSFGRYLAKDVGYTLDIGRKTKSGFKSGIYFTRTDVPAEIFGEGSFDKGFYFQIPMDLLSNNYRSNYSTFKLSPLTRDGGAKLVHRKDLKGLIYNSTNFELKRQWGGYLD